MGQYHYYYNIMMDAEAIIIFSGLRFDVKHVQHRRRRLSLSPSRFRVYW